MGYNIFLAIMVKMVFKCIWKFFPWLTVCWWDCVCLRKELRNGIFALPILCRVRYPFFEWQGVLFKNHLFRGFKYLKSALSLPWSSIHPSFDWILLFSEIGLGRRRHEEQWIFFDRLLCSSITSFFWIGKFHSVSVARAWCAGVMFVPVVVIAKPRRCWARGQTSTCPWPTAAVHNHPHCRTHKKALHKYWKDKRRILLILSYPS